MKIDFHTHIWNNQLDRGAEFVESIRELGIDNAVVLPIAPYMSNESVAKLVDNAQGAIVGFASVVPFAETTGIPREDPLTTLEHAATKLGLKGLKLHPLIQGFDLNDPGLVPLVSAAGDLELPVIFHTGPSNGRAGRMAHGRVELLDDLAMMCPGTVLVAGHANPMSDEAVYVARKHKNVYLETSISWSKWGSLIPGLIASVVSEAGPDKILYGTDYSLGREHRVNETDVVLKEANLSEEDFELVTGGNAERLLNFRS